MAGLGLEALSVGQCGKMDMLGLCWKVTGQLVSKEPGWNLTPKKLLKCYELQNPWPSITVCHLRPVVFKQKRGGWVVVYVWTSHVYVGNSGSVIMG